MVKKGWLTFGVGLMAMMPGNDLAGQAKGGALPVSWVTVRDQREQAFSIEVPKGWTIHGGMFRFGYVDARPYVDMTSPDGRVNLRVGDATIPAYVVPNPYLPKQRGATVAAYAAGDVFAAKYGQARFGSMCDGVKVTKSNAMAPKYNPAGSGLIRTTGGQAFFTCTKNGEAMAAYVYAETMLVGSGGPSSQWYVVALASVIAPVAEGEAAGALLKHSGESLALNPEWARMQQQRVNEATQMINRSTQSTIAQTQAMNAHQQKAIQGVGQQNDNFNDIINGVAFTQDASGKKYEVPLGQGGVRWVNGSNVVVESGMSPGAGFRQMQTISR